MALSLGLAVGPSIRYGFEWEAENDRVATPNRWPEESFTIDSIDSRDLAFTGAGHKSFYTSNTKAAVRHVQTTLRTVVPFARSSDTARIDKSAPDFTTRSECAYKYNLLWNDFSTRTETSGLSHGSGVIGAFSDVYDNSTRTDPAGGPYSLRGTATSHAPNGGKHISSADRVTQTVAHSAAS